jgi:hypothetical protein
MVQGDASGLARVAPMGRCRRPPMVALSSGGRAVLGGDEREITLALRTMRLRSLRSGILSSLGIANESFALPHVGKVPAGVVTIASYSP